MRGALRGNLLIKSIALAALVAGSVTSAGAQETASTSFPPLTDAMLSPALEINRKEPDAALRSAMDPDLQALIPPARNKGRAWYLWSTEWTDADERGYEAFVTAIGLSGCISMDDCLRSPANPYRDMEDEELWMGDCTDMVYVLRGYYAWKNGLPFSYEEAVRARPKPDQGSDLRYTPHGNIITSRFDVVHRQGRGPADAPSRLRGLFNIVSTAMLRTDPREDGRASSSFYSLAIDREAIRPGIAVYDAYGHVSIVYDVTSDGRVMMVSSHPDLTVSREPYGAAVPRTSKALGGGFKGWRPTRLVGATKTSKGYYVGGRIEMMPNESLEHYSLEQFTGTHPDESTGWKDAVFRVDGRAMSFVDFVRARLRDPDVPIDPLNEMATAVDALCKSFKARRTAVNLAVYAGIPDDPAPDRLPDNIYGTYGDWERYSTPSRDARLKTQAGEVFTLAEQLIALTEAGDPALAYVSHDIAAALLATYDRRASACRLGYRRSDGTEMRFDLTEAMTRLYDLSFDPFHCPEKRWGAKGEERSTCPPDGKKEDWYTAQRFLRYDPSRTYDIFTGYTAAELGDPATRAPAEGGLGRPAPPNTDVRALLAALAGDHETQDFALPTTIIELSGAINDLDAD